MITLANLAKSFGDRTLFADVSMQLNPGERYGLVGANGSGKTTLLNILAGDVEASKGEVALAQRLRLGVLRQDQFLYEEQKILNVALMGNGELWQVMEEKETLLANAAEHFDADRFSELEETLQRYDGYTAEARAATILEGLGLPAQLHHEALSTLSGGFKLRVLLAQVLASNPDVLLLDEPTNHLDAESVQWLENHLKEYAGAVLMITHDRYFLDNVVGWILELDRGSYYPYEGNYSTYLEKKAKRLEQESREESGRQKALSRELEWIRQTPSARQTKSKARIRKFEELQEGQKDRKPGKAQIVIQVPERLGGKVIEAQGLTKSFGDKVLIEGMTFSLPPGGIVGVIGPNGAGKTTLLRMLAGEESPDSGLLHIGESVTISYVDQSRSDLKSEETVWESVSGKHDIVKLGNKEVNSRQYVSWFNFTGGDQQKRISDLSGGERNRVHLAKLLRSGGNVLMLDEPTNDLDVDTLRALEEALIVFGGCAMVITHDRWFLDRIATHILAFEGGSQTFWFEGTYAEYEDHRRKRLGEAANQPHRIKYKPLKLN